MVIHAYTWFSPHLAHVRGGILLLLLGLIWRSRTPTQPQPLLPWSWHRTKVTLSTPYPVFGAALAPTGFQHSLYSKLLWAGEKKWLWYMYRSSCSVAPWMLSESVTFESLPRLQPGTNLNLKCKIRLKSLRISWNQWFNFCSPTENFMGILTKECARDGSGLRMPGKRIWIRLWNSWPEFLGFFCPCYSRVLATKKAENFWHTLRWWFRNPIPNHLLDGPKTLYIMR